jgi:hypothetical protein
VVVLITALVGLTLPLLEMSGGFQSNVDSAVADRRARLLARAALTESAIALRGGSTGAIASPAWPARLGGGVIWVTSEPVAGEPSTVRLVATAMAGTGRCSIEMVAKLNPGLGELFRATLNAKDGLTLNEGVMVDSYDSEFGTYADQAVNSDGTFTYADTNGHVMSNKDVTVNANAGIFGDCTPGPGFTVNAAPSAYIDGSTDPGEANFEFPPLEVPSYPSSGPLSVSGTSSLAPGEYRFDSLSLNRNAELTIAGPATIVVDAAFAGGKDSRLVIDATNGPVTIFCDEYAQERGFEAVAFEGSPLAVAFLVTGPKDIVFPALSKVRGAYYAENSNVVFSNDCEAWGSFVGNQVSMSSAMNFHYDEGLRRHWEGGGGQEEEPPVESLVWFETAVPSALTADRSDPFELLGVDPSALPSPTEAWVD